MRKLLIAILVVVVVGAGVGVGLAVSGSEDPAEKSATQPPLDTALDEVDTGTMVVRRDAFCDDLAPADIAEALGSEPQRAASYGNGESARLTPTLTDVSHEYACSWAGQEGTAAAAWVFAPPVTERGARTLLDEVPRRCHTVQTPAFGTPSDALLCDRGRTITFRGLFGDAWLTCQLTGQRGEEQEELVDRAGRWCVAVARAAG